MNEILAKEFDTSLPCSSCVGSGYVYYYADDARRDFSSSDSDPLTGYCCRTESDGTLYCGTDMDKVFDHYIAADAAITEERANDLITIYKEMVAAGGEASTSA